MRAGTSCQSGCETPPINVDPGRGNEGALHYQVSQSITQLSQPVSHALMI